MKEIIKNSLILCIITLVSGVLLGAVYEGTKKPRAEQEEKTKQEAYKKVFEEADRFEELEYDETALKTYLKDNGYPEHMVYIQEAVSALDSSGTDIGYVITVTDKEGYGGEITFTFGIQKDGTINGISFLTLNETAGVGMKADTAGFKNQFTGKKADSFSYVKNGKQAENEIDAISGATVTTNAVTNGVNAGILCYRILSGENGGRADE